MGDLTSQMFYVIHGDQNETQVLLASFHGGYVFHFDSLVVTKWKVISAWLILKLDRKKATPE